MACSPRYYYRFVGGNFRLDAVQAAVLLVRLPYLEGWSEERRRNAAFYDAVLPGAPYVRPECVSIYNQYVVRLRHRDEAMEYLRANGIGSAIYYPLPLHLQDCFAYLGYAPGSFPHAEAAAREVLAIPVYPGLTVEQRAHVARTLLDAPIYS
jgi:dTDP-4-amino-4,6-dideoxygalactose transaminase